MPLTTHQTPRQHWLADSFFLLIGLSILYFLWLGSYPLFTPDEGRYSEVAREMIATGDYITPRVNGVAFLDKPVLYYWLQAAAMHLFGMKEWALRFFPALIGIAGCLLSYVTGRLLFNRRTGLFAALILATTPLYFGGAHYADLNLEVAVFISGTLLCFITAMQTDEKLKPYFLFATYFFAALAFLTKGLIGIAFPGLIIGSWLILTWRLALLKRMHLIAGVVFFSILVLPWYVLVQKANPEFLHYFFVTQQVTRFLSAGEFNNKTPFWFYLPIILIGFFPWTLFLAQTLIRTLRNLWQRHNQYQTELFILLWLSVVVIFFSIPQSKTVGYIFPVFPALALLTARYLDNVWDSVKKSSLFIFLISFLILGNALGLLAYAQMRYGWLELPKGFVPYFIGMASIVSISSFIPFFFKKKTLSPFFATLLTSSVILLLTVTAGAKYLNQNSTKSLVAYLQTIIQPQDEVINYFKFYQDLPLYLQKRITIVADWQAPDIVYKDNWRRELWLGMPFQKTQEWLIDETAFWQRWHSDKRVFVFLNGNYFEQFKSHASIYYYLRDENNIILLTNKPLISAQPQPVTRFLPLA